MAAYQVMEIVIHMQGSGACSKGVASPFLRDATTESEFTSHSHHLNGIQGERIKLVMLNTWYIVATRI
jgi:hypothetical protein